MKRFYIIFFAVSILLFTLLYFSVWWFLAGIGVIMIFTAYRFYTIRLQAFRARNEGLEQQLADLQVHLDHCILKEQKTSREADEVKQSKQQLLTRLNHEIRTPMNGVMGMTLLLAETSLNREQQEYTSTIRSCSENLLTTVNNILVNDILDFSKLDREGQTVESKDFDLRDCVEEVLELFAVRAGKAGLDLMYLIDENVPAQVMGDSRRLRQVLMNLVENAVKFTNRGEIFVGVHSLTPGAGGLRQLSFEVRDTGIGIANDQVMQLFKGIPGKESWKDAAPDSKGLGLVVCTRLLELMGGQIEVKSELYQGSTFTFSIPLFPGHNSKRPEDPQNYTKGMEGKRILIVDDNSTQRKILSKQMESWKMLPATADSGLQALEMIGKNTGFDLILTDMNMPGMDGIQLAKSIRKQYPVLPVILMNPAGDEQYRQEQELFSSILVKPLRQNFLKNQILAMFTGSETGKQNTLTALSDDFAVHYPLRILIAEDDDVNQRIAIKILTKLGYKPALANNGKEALEMVSQEQYDLILMDVQMPEMDGLEATRMIRTCLEIQPVIIAMTANVMQGDRDACMQADMDDYTSKPIVLKELLGQLQKWGLVIKNRREASA